MRIFIYSLLGVFAFLLTSCGEDSLEKLSRDKVEYMDEMTEIIEGVADGSISSTDATEQINAWGKKGEKLAERNKALQGDKSNEEMIKEAEALPAEIKTAMQNSLSNYMKALQKLAASGKLTAEISEAVSNVKN